MTLMPSCLFNPGREGRKESPDADQTVSAAIMKNPVSRWRGLRDQWNTLNPFFTRDRHPFKEQSCPH